MSWVVSVYIISGVILDPLDNTSAAIDRTVGIAMAGVNNTDNNTLMLHPIKIETNLTDSYTLRQTSEFQCSRSEKPSA